jgi:hypothetical protein
MYNAKFDTRKIVQIAVIEWIKEDFKIEKAIEMR